MTNVGSRLAWLSSHHHRLLVDASEGVNDDLTFDGLAGINDDCDGSRVEHFLTLLGLNISAGQPGAEAWMGVIPADTALISANLLHHVHELLLIDWINGLD